MSGFDPWTATFEEARAAQDATGEHVRPDLPLYQWAAVQEVNKLRPAVEAGDGSASMDAIAICVRNSVIAPDWLAYAFLRSYRRVRNHDVGSWDDAFGAPLPPRARLEIWRLRRLKRIELWNYFNQTDAARNDDGWRAAAEALGITPRQAEEWTPKTRRNTRGHKPYKSQVATQEFNDPFGLIKARKKPG